MSAVITQRLPESLTPRPLGSITEERVPQEGPKGGKQFTYVDIGSIDNKTKRIVEPKTLPVTKAPSRAKQNLKAGDVLVSMTRPNLNAVALVPRELNGAVGSTGFHVLRAKEVEPGWLFYAVQTNDFVDAMCRLVQGALYPAVRPKDINAYQVALPPLTEQRRIVAEIEQQFTRLEAGVVALKRVQANLKRYHAAVLKTACEGSWLRTTVAKVAMDVRYGTSAKTSEDSDGVPVLRMGNITDGRLSLNILKFLPALHPEFPDLLLKPGDLLFNRTNSAELVGKTAVYRGAPEPCSFASYLIRVRLGDNYLPSLLSYYLNSVYGRQWIASVVSQQVGQANVNGSKLKELSIPFPPLAEQKRIVAEVERRLSVVEELEAVVKVNLTRAERLRQSILQQAFAGELFTDVGPIKTRTSSTRR